MAPMHGVAVPGYAAHTGTLAARHDPEGAVRGFSEEPPSLTMRARVILEELVELESMLRSLAGRLSGEIAQDLAKLPPPSNPSTPLPDHIEWALQEAGQRLGTCKAIVAGLQVHVGG